MNFNDQQRSVVRRLRSAVCVILTLLLAACAPGASSEIVITAESASPAPQPTATTAPTATVDAAATAAVATARVVEQQQRTAVAVAATATEAALVEPAKQVFRDTFDDNRNAWFVGRFREHEQNTIISGTFQVLHEAPGSSFELYQNRTFASFMADIDCQVLTAAKGSCGLVFGAGKGVRWSFELFSDYYRLSLYEGEEGSVLLEGDPAPLVKADGWNSLRVLRRDGQIRLYANGSLLRALDDERLPEGYVGVETGAYQEQGAGSVKVQLDNFTLWAFE
jgi:hypothetical protein